MQLLSEKASQSPLSLPRTIAIKDDIRWFQYYNDAAEGLFGGNKRYIDQKMAGVLLSCAAALREEQVNISVDIFKNCFLSEEEKNKTNLYDPASSFAAMNFPESRNKTFGLITLVTLSMFSYNELLLDNIRSGNPDNRYIEGIVPALEADKCSDSHPYKQKIKRNIFRRKFIDAIDGIRIRHGKPRRYLSTGNLSKKVFEEAKIAFKEKIEHERRVALLRKGDAITELLGARFNGSFFKFMAHLPQSNLDRPLPDDHVNAFVMLISKCLLTGEPLDNVFASFFKKIANNSVPDLQMQWEAAQVLSEDLSKVESHQVLHAAFQTVAKVSLTTQKAFTIEIATRTSTLTPFVNRYDDSIGKYEHMASVLKNAVLGLH